MGCEPNRCTLTQLGSSGEHAGNGCAGELRERWVCIGWVGRQQRQLLAGVEDTATREQADQAQPDRAKQLGDVERSEMRELDEGWRPVELFNEDAVEREHVSMWIEFQLGGNTLHDG